MEERDAEIDRYALDLEARVDLVFGRFLSGLSDDPRDAAWDVLFLALMDAGLDRVVGGMPWGDRARGVTRLAPDVREGSTRGLESARGELTRELKNKIRTVVQEQMLDKASLMRLSGKTGGLVAALSDARVAIIAAIVEQFNNTLLVWERVVLERVAPHNPVFLYAGPVDRKNRAFCAAIAPLPTVYSRAAIEELNAHPLLHYYVPPNVFTLCGGVNCRHIWLPMRRETAAAQGLTIKDAGEGAA